MVKKWEQIVKKCGKKDMKKIKNGEGAAKRSHTAIKTYKNGNKNGGKCQNKAGEKIRKKCQ